MELLKSKNSRNSFSESMPGAGPWSMSIWMDGLIVCQNASARGKTKSPMLLLPSASYPDVGGAFPDEGRRDGESGQEHLLWWTQPFAITFISCFLWFNLSDSCILLTFEPKAQFYASLMAIFGQLEMDSCLVKALFHRFFQCISYYVPAKHFLQLIL